MDQPKQQIVLLRHGETEWSKQWRHTGTTDVPLTHEGEKEARAAKAKLEQFEFAEVFVSPLSRAVETAKLAGVTDFQQLDDLVEWDYGEYEGITSAQIREQRPEWLLWRDGVEGGEAIEQVGARADRVVETAEQVAGDVLLVAHGHILRILAARWLGLGPEKGQLFALGTATISVLGFEHNYRVIRVWNG